MGVQQQQQSSQGELPRQHEPLPAGVTASGSQAQPASDELFLHHQQPSPQPQQTYSAQPQAVHYQAQFQQPQQQQQQQPPQQHTIVVMNSPAVGIYDRVEDRLLSLSEDSSGKPKSIVVAYILWLFLGWVGAHRAYLGRPAWIPVYLFSGGLFGLGLFVDLFRIPYLVHKENDYRRARHERVSTGRCLVERDFDTIDAYLLWFCFGWMGAHRFYVRDYKFGVGMLLTGGFCGSYFLIDMLQTWHLVMNANKNRSQVLERRQLMIEALAHEDPHVRKALTHVTKAAPVHMRSIDEQITIADGYTLWFGVLGLFGAHQLYLRRYWWALLYFFTVGGFGLLWLLDGAIMFVHVRNARKRAKFWDDEDCNVATSDEPSVQISVPLSVAWDVAPNMVALQPSVPAEVQVPLVAHQVQYHIQAAPMQPTMHQQYPGAAAFRV